MTYPIRLLAISSALLFAACGPAVSTPTLQTEAKTCVGDMKPLGFASIHQDPFTANGKLVFDDDASEIKSLSDSSILNAGTEVSVSVSTECTDRGEISRRLPEPPQTGSKVYSYRWQLPSDFSRAELQQLADADACVVGISESRRYMVSALPKDPEVTKQSHLMSIEAGVAYDLIYASANLRPVTIAIIDTGIDTKHPDLKNVLWQNAGEIPGNGIDDDKNGYIDDFNGYNFADQLPSPAPTGTWGNQHGTHVAGLAAAQGGNGIGVTGVMGQGAKIMMLNVFGKDSGAYVSDIANAIRYAADNGADVINMSIGGSNRSATYESALNYAVQKGVTVVVAAGNDSTEIGGKVFQSPASYSPLFEGMIAVASTDADDGSLSTFSNYNGKQVELSAPGSEVSGIRRGLLSTWPNGKYARIQGTSMASPVAAGAAGLAIAMLRARGYSPSPATIERLLSASAIRNPALADKVQFGNMLNLRTLAEYIRDHYQSQSGGSGRPLDPGVPKFEACR